MRVLAFYVRWRGLGFIGTVLASPKAGKLRKEQLFKSCTRSRQNIPEMEVVHDDRPRISEWSGETLVPSTESDKVDFHTRSCQVSDMVADIYPLLRQMSRSAVYVSGYLASFLFSIP